MSAHGQTNVTQTKVETPTINPIDKEDLQSIAHGKIPTNDQINGVLNHAKEGLYLQADDASLNAKGQQLATNANDIIKSTQKFINEKNQDGKLQDFIQHSKEAARDAHLEASKLGASAHSGGLSLPHFLSASTKHGMNRDASDALEYTKNLGLFIFKSGEFKSLLIELIQFFQNVLNDSNEKLNNLSETLKGDIKNEDETLSSTKSAAKGIGQEALSQLKSQRYEWNEARRRELYFRFKAILERVSTQPESQKLINMFWKWVDHLKVRAHVASDRLHSAVTDQSDKITSKAVQVADNMAYHSSFDKMFNDFSDLVDAFAGKGSFDKFYNQSWGLYQELLNDKEANSYFAELRSFIEEGLNNPDSLASDEKIRGGQELLDRGRTLVQSQRYQDKFTEMFSNARNLLEKIVNDKSTQDIADKLKTFGEHFALDDQGRPDLYVIQDSLVQLKNLVYPLMKEKLGALKIAKIVGSTEKFDYEIEDLTVSLPDLLPRQFELKTKSDLKVDVENTQADEGFIKVSLDLSKLKPSFHDVKFWYRKKTFPKIEDHGIVDVDLSAGEGTRILIQWKIKNTSGKPFAFSLVNVKCTVDKMDIKIRDAKHNTIDKIATSLFIGKIKQSVAQGIVDGIVGTLQPLNNSMNNWFATKPIVSLKDRANEQFHHTFQRTNEYIKEQPLSKAIDNMKARASGALEVAKIKIGNTATDVKHKAEELKESVKYKAEDIKETAKDIKHDTEKKLDTTKSSNLIDFEETPATATTTTTTTTTGTYDWYKPVGVETISTTVIHGASPIGEADMSERMEKSFGADTDDAEENFEWDSKWAYDWANAPSLEEQSKDIKRAEEDKLKHNPTNTPAV